MAYEHIMLAKEGYLLIVGRAPCDLANTIASMEAAGSELRNSPETPILVDIREAGYMPDPGEARHLAELLGSPEPKVRASRFFSTMTRRKPG